MPRAHLKGVVSFFLTYFCCCLFVLSLKDLSHWSERVLGENGDPGGLRQTHASLLNYISLVCFSMSLELGYVNSCLDKRCERNLTFILYETGLGLSVPHPSSHVSQACRLTPLCLPLLALAVNNRHNIDLCWLLQGVRPTARSFAVWWLSLTWWWPNSRPPGSLIHEPLEDINSTFS